MLESLLIANRGEIACRIINTAKNLGIRTLAVYSTADKDSLHTQLADDSIEIGGGPAAQSYLNQSALLQAARQADIQAIHPGYGFLSENPDFAEAVIKAGLIFVGPPASAIRAMGLKDAAKEIMIKAGLQVIPGYQGADQTLDNLRQQAQKIGYPIVIKARAGGGGKGMRRVQNAADFASALVSAVREAEASFGDGHVIIEKYIAAPRHIEVQIISDNFGNYRHLFERDCSLQRRHQKVIEEAPAPNMPEPVRQAMTKAAIHAAQTIGYVGAGTVEFLADGSAPLQPDTFWFMEMNTRLQVEHRVTEMITGIDLVEWQLRIASGEPITIAQSDIKISGHCVEARLYAEDPNNNFLPSPGRAEALIFPAKKGLQIDSGLLDSGPISGFYDPLFAKLICHADDRNKAFSSLADALNHTHFIGTKTNLSFLAALCQCQAVKEAKFDTSLIETQLSHLLLAPPLPLAALVFCCLAFIHEDQHLPQAWPLPQAWRLWGDGQILMRFSHGLDQLDCRLIMHSQNCATLTCGDNQISCEDLRRHKKGNLSIYRAMIAGSLEKAELVTYADTISICLNGHRWQLTKQLYLPADPPNEGQNTVISEMNASVRQIFVKPGDVVASGQSLVVLEAMKMEYHLRAKQDGIIDQVNITPEQSVDEGQVLITFTQGID